MPPRKAETVVAEQTRQPGGGLGASHERHMSEYQFYEFQAIDRPLDRAAQQALRSISSRARITATSFTNSYEWGDLKAIRANSWSNGSTCIFISRIGARDV